MKIKFGLCALNQTKLHKMKPEFRVKRVYPLFFLVFLFVSIGTYAQEVVPFSPRLAGDNIEIRGDIIFVGNNILNRASEANPSEANTPYNGTANNNSLWMEYIDIDSDASTFSSSSAELNIADPSCSQVRYAGLYWAGTYPNERSTDGGSQFNGTPRIEEWNEIKFRIPGGTYVDLIADNDPDLPGEEDDIIFDGIDPSSGGFFKDAPVICYKEVTDLIRSNSNPNGEYTAANIRATRGRRNGSSSAGWVLVIIYENPNESGKFISTFDGYAGLSGSVGNVDVAVNGFRTLPNPFPVRARVGVAALEGDRGITNDRFYIKANSVTGFTNLSTTLNPNNNFFNSTITTDGAEVPTRTPFGTNTLGTDIDLFNLNNPNETVLPNDESGAVLRFTSTGDGYGPFLTAFSVEIIEPNIVLEKRVEDIGGNDITGAGVNLGQTLDYVLSFRNLGNDDAINYSIRDVLPINTTFISADYTGAPGVTHTFDAATNEITFSIPDDLVEMIDPTYSIRLRVRVAENCFDFIDACTDLIENIAYSTYQGDINSAVITDDPSVSDFDNCGFVTPGATNFLLDDLTACNYTRTVQLCGENVVLDAGDGFDNYVWVLDSNNNGTIDASDPILNDGNPDSDLSTQLVNNTGTYIVNKQVADPCKDFNEIIIVELFGTTQINPITTLINDASNTIDGQILICPNDGDELPEVFLCGLNDTELLQINIPDADSIVWEQLDEVSCSAAPDDCANKDNTCAWNTVANGGDFLAATPGQYRLVINYQNGCFSRFYFNVFQNNLDLVHTSGDIVCTTPGNITITNLGTGYGFQLFDVTNNTIDVPFSANNGPSFDITANGAYRVEVVQLDASNNPIPNSCVFVTEDIGILDRDFQVDILTTAANCNSLGDITIQALNVSPNYEYELRLDDGSANGTLVDNETAQPDNNFTFNNVNPGDYIVITRTDDGCEDIQNITLTRIPDPTLSAVTTAAIGCSAGTIELTQTGGQGNPDFLFAIWSKDGVLLHTPGGSPTEQEIINNIDPNAYQVGTTFTFGWRDTDGDLIDEYFPGEDGEYVFIVLDANNCYAFSNPVTINDNGSLSIDSISEIQPSCNGDADGQLIINISGGTAPYQYSIDGGTTYQPTNTFIGLVAGTYNIRVLDDSGCDLQQSYDLDQPFPLSASAGVSRDVTCDPSNGAEVRITNVVGGYAPYEYSFDGGATWGASSTALLPAGNYTVFVRDATCSFPMNVTVEGLPMPPNVTLTPEVDYNCDGSGTITASPSIAGYDYRYALDGVFNTPEDNNVFTNVAPGTYTVTTYYQSQTPPTPSLLLSEDFGVGNGTIPSPDTQGYAYEDQTNDTSGGGDANSNINDFEYAVTNRIVAPFGTWLSPNDHTDPTDPDGRFLVINVGTPSPGQIIYTKPINDIIPNRPLQISLYIFNVVRSTATILNPDLTLEILDGSNNVIQSIRTGEIPKNTGPDDWVLFDTTFNPGANTSLEFVIRSEISGNNGNDLAIDDIEIFQIPEVCELSVTTPVTVEAGRVFGSTLEGSTNVSCNGLTDGTITFSVANFDAVAGFEYSEDGGTNWILSTTSPVTTNPVFGTGSQTVLIRKANEITCTTSVTQIITEPTAVIASASITTALSCTTNATITAEATGGLPGYEYQLENGGGIVIGAFDFATNGTNRVFSGLSDGTYVVRVRDTNNCEDIIDTPIVIAPMNPVVFAVTPTTCYAGSNSASIQVDVTNGNGGYQFRLNAGPWLTPTPTSATTYTFNGLSSGSFDIDVRDQSGCPVALATQTATINPELTVSATAPNISVCDTDADITITANGGDGNYVYSIVPSGNTPTHVSFNTTNPVFGFTPGNYDVYVRDNSGDTIAGYCEQFYTITITQDAALAFTPTPSDVSCFGGSDGSISITAISGGQSPYTYSIDNGATYVTGNNFPNLIAGNYDVRIRDANLCESASQTVTVDEPNQIVAEATQTQDYTCAQQGEISIGSITPTSGGSGDYQYSINGGSWTASTTGGHVFTNLTDGTYSISVRDANAVGCLITLADVIIAPLPVAPTVNYSVVYNCDGTGNATITPFDSSYIYIIDGILPGQTGAGADIFNNLSVGTHTLRVTYGADCHVDTTVIIADGNSFKASITAFENLDCNGDSSGTITIDADNYGAGGYEYSINSGVFVGPFFAPEQITGLSAQLHNIVVRDVDDPIAGCTENLSLTLTEPNAIVASATLTEDVTCDNGGATITASAIGGTPFYEYQLELNDGPVSGPYNIIAVVTPYQTSPVFNPLPANNTGESYVIRVRDRNGCEDTIDNAIITTDPDTIVFDLTPTACYSGANDGSVLVNVTAGNGNYQFRLDGGPWITPSPASATTYTFTGLSNGSYDVEVRDQFGCPVGSNLQSTTLNPNLSATISVEHISSCADGRITVNAIGGDGNYLYAFMPTGNVPVFGDFGASNFFVVTAGNDGDYDIYVRDNLAVAPDACNYMETVTVDPAVALVYTPTPTDPECHDGTGSISVNITAGDSPYTVQIIDLDNAGASDQTITNVVGSTQDFFNLMPGDYTITVTDANGCPNTQTPITINNPDELTATVGGVVPGNCTGNINDFGIEFLAYPTTLGTIEFSADGGATWTGDSTSPGTSDQITGFNPGDTVNPSMRTTDGFGNTVCQTDFPPFIVPFPLDDLDIDIFAIVVDCVDLQVTVQGTAGLAPYEYTYSEDPANFNPATATWTAPTPGNHIFTGLVPGRTYVFYVRDNSGPPQCVRQSTVNVNNLAPPPVQVTGVATPTCDGLTTGQITYTVTETTIGELGGTFDWELFRVATPAPISITTGTVSLFTSGDSFITPTPASLGAGEYFVEIRGAAPNNCIIGSENVLVEELDSITFTPNVIRNVTCANPGLVEIENPLGGGGNYTYTLSSSNFVADIVTTDNPIEVPISNLLDSTISPFNILVEIADQFSCPVTTLPSHTVSITVSQNPTVSVSTSNCTTPFGITVSASGGTSPYLYSIDGGATYLNNGGSFNNVATGTYTISIIDANGCTDTDVAEVYPTLQASAILIKLLDCTASPNAEITISATDGSGSYDYEITGPVNETRTSLPSPANSIVWNLASTAGTYTVLVYDNNRPSCPARTFTVEVPARIEPVIDTIATTDITCIGDNDGTIAISTTNNTAAPYSFEITSLDGGVVSILPTSTTSTSATFTGLAPTITAAGYIVTVTGDATTNNCSVDSASITIAEPAAIAATMDTPVEFTCTTGNNENNASITVLSAVGGSNNFVRYQFFNNLDLVTPVQDGASDTYIETNIVGGNYTINVYDDNGCVGTTTATIAPFDELLLPTITLDQVISCVTGENITINAFGSLTDSSTPAGLANYEFRELPAGVFAPSNVFTNLAVGTHNFEVRNVNTNCVVSISHVVSEPNNFDITTTITDVVCNGADGSVSFTINDPINPYAGGFDYQVFEQVTNIAQTGVLTHGTPGPTPVVNLAAGDYYVVITQTGSPLCSNPQNFSIAGPNGLITATPLITPISCLPGNDGVIEITDVQGGWGGYQYYVSNTPIPDEFDSSHYTTNPRFDNLSAGTYEIWIIDQNGCPRQLTDEVLAVPPAIVADLRTNQGNCNGFDGEIEVVGIPATSPISGGQGSNYSYQLYRNATAVGVAQTTTLFSGLGEGTYTVEIIDQLGCTLLVGPQILYDIIAPVANIAKTIDCLSGGDITVTQTGGSGVFDYEVRYPGTLLTDPADDTQLASGSASFTNLTIVGDYVFTITDTATGHMCSTTITQRLEDSVIPNLSVDNHVDVSCNGADDGTISVSADPDNGIGPYTFTIISGPGSSYTFPISPNPASVTNATAVFDNLEGTIAGITYTIRVTAANSCTQDIAQVINQPNIISNVNANVVEFGCAIGNNASNASITIDTASIVGGSGNFVRFEFINTGTATTVQDGSNPVYIETDYAGGNYDVFVYDDRGCRNVVATNVNIAPFVEITDPVITDLVPLTCNPGSDAQIQVGVTLNPISGTPNLQYTINGINVTFNDTNNTGLFTGLGAGDYSITITNLDAHPNCVIETVHTVEEPLEMDVLATKLTDEECLNNGLDDGSFNIAITDYVGTYSYQVFDSNNNPVAGQSGIGTTSAALPPFTNLPGGTYYVVVTQTQAPFCIENSNVITILAPDAPISATISEESSVSCTNNQGRLLVNVDGGEGPYTISLDNTTTGQSYVENNVSGFVFTNLSAGDFTITITDAYSCVFTDAITLIRPDDITATITPSTLVCFGDDTASVTASVAPRNVTVAYEYQLNIYSDILGSMAPQVSSRQVLDTFDNLSAGFYSITVTDDVGCSAETAIIQIVDPTEVSAQLLRLSPLTCTTQAELELIATGGIGPYSYSVDGINFFPMNEINGADTHLFTNIGAGTYSYFVQDAFNCSSIISNEITEDVIEPLTLTVDASAAVINCTGESTAIIYADADGGLGNYQYELYTDVSLSLSSRIAGPQVIGEFSNLPQGDYYVNVTSDDCTAPAIHVPITEPASLTYVDDVVNVTCNGEENGSISVTLSGGSGGYQYAISPNLDQFDVENTFTDLAPGDYTVIAQDQNGCFELLQYTITEPNPIAASTVSVLPEVCEGSEDGSFELTISGGTAPYHTSLNSSNTIDFVQDQFIFNNLAAGTYVVFIRDAQNCEETIIVEIEPGVNLNAAITPIYECNGIVPDNRLELLFEDNSVLTDVLYAMDSTDPADMQLTADFTNLIPGNHTLTIAHANGCMNMVAFAITDFAPLTLSLEQNNINEITAVAAGGLEEYTFFFGDVDNGTDNTFIINRTDTYMVTLVDQNGCEVSAEIFMEFIDIEIPNFFTPDGDDWNDGWSPENLEAFPNVLTIIFDRYGRELYRMEINDAPWNGVYHNEELPTGDYWYVIKLRGENDDREFVGHFTLYR
ncbi:T9SS type B sorting domain-containing protein [Croceitalea rosinachiae]|uniref:T9SS type B sorting domain-containing protein n=1 Tax=Croceitalea rosinachiae TaxID=3075596 RepID=A0ABU3A7W7_9FLAO|nr:T9SS type B sorting domain-containing protein [Croceitalea sp. F388]MDT0606279.1 T9SS type B sorting domain-containing protein [Croceitalea sp. F388]